MEETAEKLRQQLAWRCGQLVALEAAFSFLYKATSAYQKFDEVLEPSAADLEYLQRCFDHRMKSIQTPDPAETKRAARQGLDRLLRELSLQKTGGLFQAMAPLPALLANDRDDADKPLPRTRTAEQKAAAAKRVLARRRARRPAPPKAD